MILGNYKEGDKIVSRNGTEATVTSVEKGDHPSADWISTDNRGVYGCREALLEDGWSVKRGTKDEA